jgi:hypothetical protein
MGSVAGSDLRRRFRSGRLVGQSEGGDFQAQGGHGALQACAPLGQLIPAWKQLSTQPPPVHRI